MSASKSTSNSSKTAHVMNLLRKNEPAQAAEKGVGTPAAAAASAIAEAPAPVEAPAPRANPQVPPILTSLNADAEISDQIRDALETALSESVPAETAQAAPAAPLREPSPPAQAQQAQAAPAVPPQAPEQAPLAGEAPAPPADVPPQAPAARQAQAAAAPQPVQEPQPEPVAQPVMAQPAAPAPAREEPRPTAAPPAADKPDPTVPTLHNVMLRLTEERARKYIGLFGLCQCDRCRNDVIALTLNNLSPQYVVMSSAELLVRQDMYGNRFNSEITAQLLRACKEVMDNPRHTL